MLFFILSKHELVVSDHYIPFALGLKCRRHYIYTQFLTEQKQKALILTKRTALF